MAFIEKSTYKPDNFVAGAFPIAVDSECTAGEGGVKKYAPVTYLKGVVSSIKKGEDGSLPADGIYGIAMNDAEAEGHVDVWLTGEYFADALELENGVEIADLKLPLRKIGIFLI